ncbi:MAG: PIG-L deacetylase family protein [Bryobacteraceae bacterium]
MTRRTLFNSSAAGIIADVLLARGQQPSEKAPAPLDLLPGAEKNRKLKVVFVGAHVDDWGVCAGTLARYALKGHQVLCFSFTPGDSQSMADEHHMSVDKLAALRREDATRGTKIIGAQFKILNQHNQNMRVDPQVYDDFNKTLAPENPDIVFGMWPLEFHPDHRAAANIAYNAWLASGMRFAFYFSETQEASEMTAQQFLPNRWVDIESVIELKRRSIDANTLLEGWWPECEMWAKFRGGEYGCKYAEAFVHISTVASIAPKNIAPRSWFGGGVQINRD